MAKIARYPVLDFSGGIRRDKGPFEIQKNELLDARNVFLDERGRITTRRGSQQIGQTLTGTLENSYFFQRAASIPAYSFLLNNTAGTVWRLVGGQLVQDITTATTTFDVAGSVGFAAGGGIVEIGGDLITYGSFAGSTFSTVSGITSSHSAGAPVHQWASVTTGLAGGRGITYATLGNAVFFGGSVGNTPTFVYINNDDAVTVSTVSGEPSGLFITNYRDRLYSAGESSPQNRTFFSARGDGTSWTTSTDYFDVNDKNGEPITGYRVLNDRLGIFKANSTFTYDEIELKQRSASVGAYNNKVPQEIDGLIYTFCPSGIYKTNLAEAKQIGDPVREYWENFTPVYDSSTTTVGRVVTNTFAGTFLHYYLLYIHDITSPTTTNDVVLAYDTLNNNWTVHPGTFTDFFFLNGHNSFAFGSIGTQDEEPPETIPSLWGGGSNSRMYRLFETKHSNRSHARAGGDLFYDLFSDTGTPISASVEFPAYDLTYPELFKTFKFLRVLSERGVWSWEYRIEDESGKLSSYRPLGVTSRPHQILPFPKEAQGYRCGLRASSVNTASTSILNGFVFEDTEVNPRT